MNSSRIVGLPMAASSSEGEDVHFSLKLQNGEIQTFICARDKVGELMKRLGKGVELAARKQREQGSANNSLPEFPVAELDDIDFTVTEDGSALILEFQTADEEPIYVQASMSVIAGLSDRLQSYAERLAKTPPPVDVSFDPRQKPEESELRDPFATGAKP